MVKMFKLGRFAVAYDNRPSATNPPRAAAAPPPKTPKAPRSFWDTLRRIVFVIMSVIGVLIVLLVIAVINTPVDDYQLSGGQGTSSQLSGSATQQSYAATQDVATQLCGRADVQDLAGKEARSIILASAREQTLMLAIYGLMDPSDFARAFEAAEVTFSDVYGSKFSESSYMCSAGLKIDASNATTGQDILQSPRFVWSVVFANAGADPMSANFTVVVMPETIADGMLINGVPAENAFPQDASQQDGAAE